MTARMISEEMLRRVREADPEVSAAIDAVYGEIGDTMMEAAESYHNRHMTQSMNVLTVLSSADARRLVKPLRGTILNRSVVEIGGGVGYLALELARYSPQVFSIESDPAWTWLFAKHLYAVKPAHLTWIFGRGENVAPYFRADVAVIATRSGHVAMQAVAKRMAPVVIDIYETQKEKL